MDLINFFDFSPFIEAVRNAIINLSNLFTYIVDIFNSFFNRVSDSPTFIFSFVVILFSTFVISTCITIWRH